MPLKSVFFDLDGTLLDTSKDLGCALNYTLGREGLAPLTQETIRPYVSQGATALITLGFGAAIDKTNLQRYREILLEFYLDNIATHTTPFPGINELIENCSSNKISWGVVTNKPRLYTEVLLSKMKFASPASAVVCPDHLGISKPNPEPLLHACKLAQCYPSEAIYIGDHLRDIECGKNAKMDTIAVGYGFTASPTEHLDWNATYNVTHADEIWPIINSKY